ncbi:MAG: RHS repeat-associated core domain-containing protein [Ardenticatenales bacterium]|nr:RHS repeat-associated core domain-containing protein [Ardenticatenales bacterium]
MSYNNGGGMVAGSRTRYLPFGAYRTAPSQTYTDRGYTGQKHNDDLGLIYYNARYYLPGVGRFVSADTLVPDPTSPQSYNRFSYVRNNPVNRIDPTGHFDMGSYEDGYNEYSEIYRYYKDIGWSDEDITLLFTFWETQYRGWWDMLIQAKVGDYVDFEAYDGINMAIQFSFHADGDMPFGPGVMISAFTSVGGEDLGHMRLDHVLHGYWDWEHGYDSLSSLIGSRHSVSASNMLLLRSNPLDSSQYMFVIGTGHFSDPYNPMPEIDWMGTSVDSAGWFTAAGIAALHPEEGVLGELILGGIGVVNMLVDVGQVYESQRRLSRYTYPTNP